MPYWINDKQWVCDKHAPGAKISAAAEKCWYDCGSERPPKHMTADFMRGRSRRQAAPQVHLEPSPKPQKKQIDPQPLKVMSNPPLQETPMKVQMTFSTPPRQEVSNYVGLPKSAAPPPPNPAPAWPLSEAPLPDEVPPSPRGALDLATKLKLGTVSRPYPKPKPRKTRAMMSREEAPKTFDHIQEPSPAEKRRGATVKVHCTVCDCVLWRRKSECKDGRKFVCRLHKGGRR